MVALSRRLVYACRLACFFSMFAGRGESIFATSEPGQPPEYCTVFHHMVKSAGSTIKSLLQKASVREGVTRPTVCVNGITRIPTCLEAINSSAVITGCAELVRRPLEAHNRACEYFTVMRNPIDRLVSAFFYCPTDHDVQSRPEKWCGYAEHPIPATDRLLEFAQYGWQNKAFKQMTFGLYCPPATFCEEVRPGPPQNVDEPGGLDLLQQIENILASYTAIGIMDHWDLSMQLFNARVRSPVRDWNVFKQANSGKMSGLRDEVYQWAHTSSAIHRAIGSDMLLYSYSLAIFKQQTAAALGTDWQDM